MKTGTAFVTTLFALASFALPAQQPSPANQPQPGSPAAGTEAPAAEMSPVNGELVSKLDSKTAKAGDSVVVQTKSSVRTADGTEIPRGSKLVGHVMAARPSAAGENSQVALQFDHVELKGGQSVPVHSQIQSISPAGSAASTSAATSASTSGSAVSAPPTSGSSSPSASGSSTASGDPGTAPAGNTGPAPGTIVARTGNIAIRTTSIPGVVVANNAPGQQDPRMGQSSGILIGAKQDIELDGGTQMVVGVSDASGGTQ
jgi:hypothetical protein